MGSRQSGDKEHTGGKAGVENVYAAANKWVDCALRNDDSLFTPGKAIWSSRCLAELREWFPDSRGAFLEKLKKRLWGSPRDVYQLMAEAYYVHFLIVWRGSIRPDTKLDRINEVIGWSYQAMTIPADLVDGLTPGMVSSRAFGQYPEYHLAFLIEFAEQWKEQESDERQRLLEDPWAFKDFATGLTFRSQLLEDYSGTTHLAQREALYHLVFPDHFEGMVNVENKKRIADAQPFQKFVTQQTAYDVDRRLQQIRKGLEAQLGRDFDFYDDPYIRAQWRDD